MTSVCLSVIDANCDSFSLNLSKESDLTLAAGDLPVSSDSGTWHAFDNVLSGLFAPDLGRQK
jgi:hypothetical protein